MLFSPVSPILMLCNLKAMDINRLINRLHPRAPKSHIDSVHACMRNKTGDLPDSFKHYSCYQAADSVSLDANQLKPLSNEDYILELDLRENLDRSFSARYLFEIENCQVFGPAGDLLTEHAELLTEFTPQNGVGSDHTLFRRRRFPKPQFVKGKSFNLLTPFCTNYYHWILEALPTLQSISKTLETIDWFIVPKSTAFHASTLFTLGVPEHKLLVVDNNSSIICETLYTTSVQRSMLPPPESASWLKSRYVTDSLKSSTKGDTRLFISRGDSGWRRTLNEQEVSKFLQKYGFQTVELSTLSFSEQAALFHNASHIISTHGAGLANLAFCKAGTKLLEIHPPRWTSMCYAALSHYTGCDYYYCNADPLGLTADEVAFNKAFIPQGSSSQGGNLSIPLDKLAIFCEQHL